MARSLSPAEQELLALYTRKAYDIYLTGNLKETEAQVRRIQELNPGDVNAVFLRGAICGRGARPGEEMKSIGKALEIWRPLDSALTGEAHELMANAMAEAFSVMTYTPVELAVRRWNVYLSASAAEELTDTLDALLALDDSCSESKDPSYGKWIHEQFKRNYVFWLDEVVSVDMAVPVGGENRVVRSYGHVLDAACCMAERIPGSNHSEVSVKNRVMETRRRYLELNPSIPAS